MTNSVAVAGDLERSNDILEHALLRSWIDVADMGLCVLDTESHAVMLNKAACKLLGIDGLAMLNAPLKELLKEVQMKAGMVLLIQTPGFEGERQATRQTPSGTLHLQLRFRSVRVGTGPRFKMLSITDITQALVVEAQEEQRRQWQAMNAGVVISDALSPDMPVVYVNTAFEKMSGYSSAEMLGRNCRHLQGKETDQPAIDNIRTAIRNQSTGYAVLRNYRKDGSLFVNELFVSPIKDANGKVTHFMGIQHLRDASFVAS